VLANEHHTGAARRLHARMHQTAWTTGSELVGELSLALNDMPGSYSPALTQAIPECRAFAIHHRRLSGLK
jgi:hypothetical protein